MMEKRAVQQSQHLGIRLIKLISAKSRYIGLDTYI